MTQGLIETITNIANYLQQQNSTYSNKNEVAVEVYWSCAEFWMILKYATGPSFVRVS